VNAAPALLILQENYVDSGVHGRIWGKLRSRISTSFTWPKPVGAAPSPIRSALRAPLLLRAVSLPSAIARVLYFPVPAVISSPRRPQSLDPCCASCVAHVGPSATLCRARLLFCHHVKEARPPRHRPKARSILEEPLDFFTSPRAVAFSPLLAALPTDQSGTLPCLARPLRKPVDLRPPSRQQHPHHRSPIDTPTRACRRTLTPALHHG
jgi:hypothetical protein